MTKKTTHYTNFGVSIAPRCADASGYIAYRDTVVDRLVRGEDVRATAGERWIAKQEARINAWRKGA